MDRASSEKLPWLPSRRRSFSASHFTAAPMDGKHDDGKGHHHKPKLLSCDDTLKDEFKPDSLTTVLLVKAFKKGEPLALSGTPPDASAASRRQRRLRRQAAGGTRQSRSGRCAVDVGGYRHRSVAADARELEQADPRARRRRLGGRRTNVADVARRGRCPSPGPRPVRRRLPPSKARFRQAPIPGTVITGTGSFAMNPDGTINTVLWRRFRPARDPPDGREDEGAHQGVLRQGCEVRLLGRLLHRRPAGPQARASFIRTTSTVSSPVRRLSTGRASSPTSCIRRSWFNGTSVAFPLRSGRWRCLAMPRSMPATW